jgi:predicted benzoate:H+ symporter BenE
MATNALQSTEEKHSAILTALVTVAGLLATIYGLAFFARLIAGWSVYQALAGK